jgi:predicted nucleotidyltransferase component of viral defense system
LDREILRAAFPLFSSAVVASLHDPMAQKLKVVMRRIEAKDYGDIAALIRARIWRGRAD